MPAVSVGGMADLVNKRELAKILRCSLPTVGALLDRYPDFPVERRGSNGVEWQFDPAAVTTFLQRRREDETAAAAEQHRERAALLDQFRLPIDDLAPPADATLTPQQRLATARARALEDKMAREAGLLVPTSQVRATLSTTLAQLNQFLAALPGTLGRQYNLPDPVVRDMRRRIEAQQRQLVAQLGALAPPDTAPDDVDPEERDAA